EEGRQGARAAQEGRRRAAGHRGEKQGRARQGNPGPEAEAEAGSRQAGGRRAFAVRAAPGGQGGRGRRVEGADDGAEDQVQGRAVQDGRGHGRSDPAKDYRPGADEEYMSALQLEYFRQRLLQWRADLVEESKQTIENLKDEVRDVGDEAERATRETENSLELRTRDRYRKLIGKIDSTLKRVDSGEYGYSVDSGEEIGLDRLEARLTAERTIDEQERWEHLQKQIGD